MAENPRSRVAFLVTLLVVVSALAALPGAVVSSPVGPERPDVGAALAGGQPAGSVETESALESGTEYWRGFDLRFDGSRIVEDPAAASVRERTFGLWRVSDDGKLVERITRFTIGDDGETTIPTAGFRGRVVLLYDEQPVYVRDGVGYLSSPPDGPAVTVENSTWRVTEQTLDVSWADRSLYDGQGTDLELRSNRETYTVAVTSDDLAPDAIERVFREAGVDVRREGNATLLYAGTRTTVPVNVTDVGPGEYFLEFDVVDTTAAAASQVTVAGPPSTRIADVERVERTGDYLEATVACEHCYLFVGGPVEGVFDLVELDDRNDDGRVTVGVNTRYVGMRESEIPSGSDVYRAGASDAAERFSPSDRVAPPDVNTHYGLGRVRSEIGLDAAGRRTPIPTGRYDLTLASTPYVAIHGGYAIRDERHVQSVHLTRPGLDGMSTAVLPKEVSAEPSLGTVIGGSSPAGEVAVGDRLVLRIDVTGVFGSVVGTHDGELSGLVDNEAEGIDLTLSGPTRTLDLRSIARLVVDEDRSRLYVVVDTGALRLDRPIEAPRPYQATLAIDGDAYPYLEPGRVERATANVSLVEPSASITSTKAASGRIRIDGRSSLAPGSLITVRVAAASPYSWGSATGVVVGSDGSWTGSVDVRDAPGRQFSVGVYDNHRKLAGPETVALEEDTSATATPSPTETTVATTEHTSTTSSTGGTRTAESPSGTTTRPPTETTTAPTSPSGTTAAPTSPPVTTTASPRTPGTTAPSARTTVVTASRTTPATSSPSGPPDDRDGSGVPFAPDLPSLPTPVSLAVLLGLFGGVGGAAFLSRRP